MDCRECSNAVWNPAIKEVDCGLSAEKSFTCPNLIDAETRWEEED